MAHACLDANAKYKSSTASKTPPPTASDAIDTDANCSSAATNASTIITFGGRIAQISARISSTKIFPKMLFSANPTIDLHKQNQRCNKFGSGIDVISIFTVIFFRIMS